ncbi:gibberellin-regulated protein 9-like [Nicotiana sylvestris]|uniref:Gibberellin-regulated protein 9-like n=1 Tax=Nicotiana sylvestris TaxID=4096 RepID=A0A1U7Y894_NICSY|nr:PREDICTED: gibberellin-regulated protein 9-like [Nicotiana sylvestris]
MPIKRPASSFQSYNSKPRKHLVYISQENMKIFTLVFIAILLIQVFAEAVSFNNAEDTAAQIEKAGNEGALFKKIHHQPIRKINCGHACARRCRKSSRKNVCKRACKSCCARCHCVPPGTYGNKEACPCYARLKTHGNRPKCP